MTEFKSMADELQHRINAYRNGDEDGWGHFGSLRNFLEPCNENLKDLDFLLSIDAFSKKEHKNIQKEKDGLETLVKEARSIIDEVETPEWIEKNNMRARQ